MDTDKEDVEAIVFIIETLLLIVAGVIGTILLLTLEEVNIWVKLFLIVIGWFGDISLWKLCLFEWRKNG